MYTDVKGCILLVTTYSERNVQSALINLKAKLWSNSLNISKRKLFYEFYEFNFDAMLNREHMEI